MGVKSNSRHKLRGWHQEETRSSDFFWNKAWCGVLEAPGESPFDMEAA